MPANPAYGSIASPRRTVLAAIIDHLQVKRIPSVIGKQPLKVPFRLLDISPLGQLPALGQSMNMGIYRKGGNPKGLGHDHAGGFVSDPGKLFEFGEGRGDLPCMLLNQESGEGHDGLGLLGCQPAGPDDLLDFLDRNTGHRRRMLCPLEQSRGDLIDPHVRTLSAQQDCDQKGVGIRMV